METYNAVMNSQSLTPADRARGERCLEQAHQRMSETTEGLSEAQWNFKPSAECWSLAENLEHIALIEKAVITRLGAISESPAAPADRDLEKDDAAIVASVLDRSTKVQAPPFVSPAGRWTPAGTLEQLADSRQQLHQLLRSDVPLRAHIVAHPILGQLDGFQWLLAVAAHGERHLAQMLEVKSNALFPAMVTVG